MQQVQSLLVTNPFATSINLDFEYSIILTPEIFVI
jgi:hypothetical protein